MIGLEERKNQGHSGCRLATPAKSTVSHVPQADTAHPRGRSAQGAEGVAPQPWGLGVRRAGSQLTVQHSTQPVCGLANTQAEGLIRHPRKASEGIHRPLQAPWPLKPGPTLAFLQPEAPLLALGTQSQHRLSRRRPGPWLAGIHSRSGKG